MSDACSNTEAGVACCVTHSRMLFVLPVVMGSGRRTRSTQPHRALGPAKVPCKGMLVVW